MKSCGLGLRKHWHRGYPPLTSFTLERTLHSPLILFLTGYPHKKTSEIVDVKISDVIMTARAAGVNELAGQEVIFKKWYFIILSRASVQTELERPDIKFASMHP